MWVRSPKIGSSLECGVLPSFPLPALSSKHLLALYSFTLYRNSRPKPPESCTLKKSNCCNKLLIRSKRDDLSGSFRTDRRNYYKYSGFAHLPNALKPPPNFSSFHLQLKSIRKKIYSVGLLRREVIAPRFEILFTSRLKLKKKNVRNNFINLEVGPRPK